jgi:hypothetical protein
MIGPFSHDCNIANILAYILRSLKNKNAFAIIKKVAHASKK